jgi:hypothetical protein
MQRAQAFYTGNWQLDMHHKTRALRILYSRESPILNQYFLFTSGCHILQKEKFLSYGTEVNNKIIL